MKTPLGLLPFVLVLGLGASFLEARRLPPEASVIVYDRGRRQPVARDARGVAELVAACEDRLREADGSLRLAVSRQLIDKIQATETALEIVYPEQRTFELTRLGGRTVRARRLLIPLTGELAGEVTTLFVGDARYENGPLRIRQDTEELRRLWQAVSPK